MLSPAPSCVPTNKLWTPRDVVKAGIPTPFCECFNVLHLNKAVSVSSPTHMTSCQTHPCRPCGMKACGTTPTWTESHLTCHRSPSGRWLHPCLPPRGPVVVNTALTASEVKLNRLRNNNYFAAGHRGLPALSGAIHCHVRVFEIAVKN